MALTVASHSTFDDPKVTRAFADLSAVLVALLPFTGNGSPQGVVVADVGRTYMRLDGGAGTTLYVKEADPGLNTGWVAK